MPDLPIMCPAYSKSIVVTNPHWLAMSCWIEECYEPVPSDADHIGLCYTHINELRESTNGHDEY